MTISGDDSLHFYTKPSHFTPLVLNFLFNSLS